MADREKKLGRFDENFGFSSRVIRFTTIGTTLYAYCLGKPDSDILIKSLAKSSELVDKAISSIQMVESMEKINWKQTAEYLVIKKPGTINLL